MKPDSAKVTAKEVKSFYEFLPKENRPALNTYYGEANEGYKKLNTFSVLAEKINGFKDIITASNGFHKVVTFDAIILESSEKRAQYIIGRNALIDHFITRLIPQ